MQLDEWFLLFLFFNYCILVKENLWFIFPFTNLFVVSETDSVDDTQKYDVIQKNAEAVFPRCFRNQWRNHLPIWCSNRTHLTNGKSQWVWMSVLLESGSDDRDNVTFAFTSTHWSLGASSCQQNKMELYLRLW